MYVQSHIPVKLRDDLMSNGVEVIQLQVHLPHLKLFLVGSCYRPPSANSQYLDNMCEILDNVFDINREVYFLGDLNIDWLSSSCPSHEKASNFNQCLQPGSDYQSTYSTRVLTNSTGMESSMCIDHNFTNAAKICCKEGSKSIGCSDYNIIAISRKTKVPKAGPNIVYKRSYNNFCRDRYVEDVKNI